MSEELFETLKKFSQLPSDPSWQADSQNAIGMQLDVSAALLCHRRRLREISRRVEGHVDIREVAWVGKEPGSLAQLHEDFYRMYGMVAETQQFIACEQEERGIVYHVVVGNEQHGHHLEFRIVGKRIEEALDRLEEGRSKKANDS